jgi:hypothetical protein
MKNFVLLILSLFVIAFSVIPAAAGVGGGGGFSGPAIGPRGGSVVGVNGGSIGSRAYGTGCCYGGYSGYEIATPGTTTTSSAPAGPAYGVTTAAVPGTPGFVSSKPVEPSAPIGSIEYSLPKGCISTFVSGASYYQCGGTYYKAVYQSGTLVYEAVKAPY